MKLLTYVLFSVLLSVRCLLLSNESVRVRIIVKVSLTMIGISFQKMLTALFYFSNLTQMRE